MKQTELEKKFSDKKFLKKNEFVELMGRVFKAFQENRALMTGLVVICVVLALGIPGYKYYQKQQYKAVNELMYEAKNSLKKEALYQQVIDQYGSLQLSLMARIELADYYIENKRDDDALNLLDIQSLNFSPSLLTTTVVLKKLALLKKQEKFDDALAYLESHKDLFLEKFEPQAKLYKARLLWLSKKNDQAKTVLTQMKLGLENQIEMAKKDQDKSKEVAENRQVLKEVNDQLLLIELGLM